MATYRNTKNGTIRTSLTLMGYPWIEVSADGDPVNPSYELAAETADAILNAVGNDAELAQLALTKEAERDKPRTVLTAKLQRIVDNAES